MKVYTIHTNRKNMKGGNIFIHFGCDFPDIESLIAEINTGKIVFGWNLRTRFDRDAEGEHLVIVDKAPYGITVRGITGVENPRHRFVEFTS